jgi:hypothetical protein
VVGEVVLLLPGGLAVVGRRRLLLLLLLLLGRLAVRVLALRLHLLLLLRLLLRLLLLRNDGQPCVRQRGLLHADVRRKGARVVVRELVDEHAELAGDALEDVQLPTRGLLGLLGLCLGGGGASPSSSSSSSEAVRPRRRAASSSSSCQSMLGRRVCCCCCGDCCCCCARSETCETDRPTLERRSECTTDAGAAAGRAASAAASASAAACSLRRLVSFWISSSRILLCSSRHASMRCIFAASCASASLSWRSARSWLSRRWRKRRLYRSCAYICSCTSTLVPGW